MTPLLSLDVVIPTHNAAQWLEWCLEELFRFPAQSLGRVIVVNDRSTPDQTNKIRQIVQRFAQVHYVENTQSAGGFGFACNLGAKESTAQAIVFLNTDCLLTSGVLDDLSAALALDPDIALVCPVSNNSPALSLPMLPGTSYRQMSEQIRQAYLGVPLADQVLEACTVVGNCLAVRRDFFQAVNGYSPEWGVGYGEETDLHMKALEMGKKGMVHLGCYVFHFGGGTFDYEADIEAHKAKNYQLFMSKWAAKFDELQTRCNVNPPLVRLSAKLAAKPALISQTHQYDALFYLPCIDQGIGGIHAVIGICNELIRAGLKVGCALVDPAADVGLKNYLEPILFNFLRYDSEEQFIYDPQVNAKVVFSTAFFTSPAVSAFAKLRGSCPVQFVQGYEVFFHNGTQYHSAYLSYAQTQELVTTSPWLMEKVGRHLAPDAHLVQLPLIVNDAIFYSSDAPRRFDVGMVFRAGLDKGQWLLAEILDSLPLSKLKVVVICASTYPELKIRYANQVEFVDLPLDRYALANVMRQIKVFVDCSIYEGFGLLPLEAALCGCAIVSSDSGGVRGYASLFDMDLVAMRPDAKEFVSAIINRLDHFRVTHTPWISPKKATQAWIDYIHARSEGVHLAPPKPKPIDTSTAQIASTAPEEGLKVSLKRAYRVIAPWVPRRIALAMKALILGRVN